MAKKKDKIYFYIPDFSVRFNIISTLLSRMKTHKKYYRPNIEIGAIYGSFGSAIWNGGRAQLMSINLKDIRRQIDYYHAIQMPIRFTWTNPALRPFHYEDEYCNLIMDWAQNGINEVLVNDSGLEHYIRLKYPKYPILSSTTKRITDESKLSKEMSKDYKLVVLDYDLNNKWDILENIKEPGRCEILVNAACNPNCPFRKQHYHLLGKNQLRQPTEFPIEIASCAAYSRRVKDLEKFPTFVSWEDIEKEYVPRGFRHFKIEGRTLPHDVFIESLVYYLVRDEYKEQETKILLEAATKDVVDFHV